MARQRHSGVRSSLARLAAAYEFDRAQQQDLLQEIHLALWRSFAGFRNQCSLRTSGASGVLSSASPSARSRSERAAYVA